MTEYICIVCNRPVKDTDNFIWHGCDGDKIHEDCEKNLQQVYDYINNMTKEEFAKYLTGDK